MLPCNWSKVYHLDYRLTGKDMKWQAPNSFRSNSIGYKIKLRQVKRYFTISLQVLKSISGLNFILSPIWSICHFIFFISRGTLASPYAKTIAKFVEKWNLKTDWQKFIWYGNKISWNIKIAFSLQGGALVFDGIFSQLLPLRNFCDQNFLKGNLFKFFSKKL